MIRSTVYARIAFLLLAFSAALPLSVLAQTKHKKGPEQKVLADDCGVFIYKGEEMDTPIGHKGKFVGTTITRMMADGFVQESKSRDTGTDWVQYTWWDPSSKGYVYIDIEPTGTVEQGKLTIEGNVWTTLGVRVEPDGRRVIAKGVTTYHGKGKARDFKSEISLDDGKTWQTWFVLTSRPVRKAANTAKPAKSGN